MSILVSWRMITPQASRVLSRSASALCSLHSGTSYREQQSSQMSSTVLDKRQWSGWTRLPRWKDYSASCVSLWLPVNGSSAWPHHKYLVLIDSRAAYACLPNSITRLWLCIGSVSAVWCQWETSLCLLSLWHLEWRGCNEYCSERHPLPFLLVWCGVVQEGKGTTMRDCLAT